MSFDLFSMHVGHISCLIGSSVRLLENRTFLVLRVIACDALWSRTRLCMSIGRAILMLILHRCRRYSSPAPAFSSTARTLHKYCFVACLFICFLVMNRYLVKKLMSLTSVTNFSLSNIFRNFKHKIGCHNSFNSQKCFVVIFLISHSVQQFSYDWRISQITAFYSICKISS